MTHVDACCSVAQFRDALSLLGLKDERQEKRTSPQIVILRAVSGRAFLPGPPPARSAFLRAGVDERAIVQLTEKMNDRKNTLPLHVVILRAVSGRAFSSARP
jgi:hypothetical protein